MSSDWESQIQQDRDRKDQFFASNPRSPIPADQREAFDGLRYFDPDPAFRVTADLDEFDSKQSLVVETTTDGEREYQRWGEFSFEVAGESVTLQAYKADPDEDRLWVPFRDATSGGETYGAGRYLDLEAADHRTDEGTWTLDFNEAYNPFCVYSERYECPLVPAENWLDVAIEAGEKDYTGPKRH